MKTIVSRTLETVFRKSVIIIMVILGIAAGVMMKSMARLEENTYNTLLAVASSAQHLLVFFLIGGATMGMVCANASGNIAGEYQEGTLRLLVAKPNTRGQVLLAKLVATIGGEFVLYLLSLLAYYSTISILKVFDGYIIAQLVAYLPGYLLYGLFVIIVLTGMGTLLSCIFNKRLIALLPMLALVIITLAFFPIQRMVMMISDRSLGGTLDLIDTNYHFAAVLSLMLKPFGGVINYTTTVEMMALLVKLFSVQYLDMDISGSMNSPLYVENTSLNGMAVFLIYMGIAALCYLLSYYLFRKKDV